MTSRAVLTTLAIALHAACAAEGVLDVAPTETGAPGLLLAATSAASAELGVAAWELRAVGEKAGRYVALDASGAPIAELETAVLAPGARASFRLAVERSGRHASGTFALASGAVLDEDLSTLPGSQALAIALGRDAAVVRGLVGTDGTCLPHSLGAAIACGAAFVTGLLVDESTLPARERAECSEASLARPGCHGAAGPRASFATE